MEKEQNKPNNAVGQELALYEQLRAVPNNAQKDFTGKGGFKGTDINPMWRIKRMTEIFGPVGFGWYYEVVNRHIEKASDNETLCTFVAINLFVKRDGEWSKPIYGEGGNTFSERIFSKKANKEIISVTDEAYKMALTDAFSNATKQLGLGADIWFENDKVHSTKYDQQQERNKQQQSADNAAPTPSDSDKVKSAITEMKATKSLEDAQKAWNAHKDIQHLPEYLNATQEMIAKFKQPQKQAA